jgi:uncharacterized protein
MNTRKVVTWGAALLAVFFLVRTLLGSRTNAAPADPLYAQAVLAGRAQKDSVFRAGSGSPLAVEAKVNFRGLQYFAIDASWRVNATFALAARGPAFGDSLALPIGVLTFEYQGRSYTLTAFRETGTAETRLFIPFRDKTNGSSTYGGGRYLVAERIEGQSIILDFNLAYHPYCAYNPAFVCPAVPPENHLPFSIAAGESGYATSE